MVEGYYYNSSIKWLFLSWSTSVFNKCKPSSNLSTND